MKKVFQPILDTVLGWTVSKKLSVWIVGTVMVFMEITIPDNYLYLTLLYLGVQGVVDIIKERAKAQIDNSSNFGGGTIPIPPENLER